VEQNIQEYTNQTTLNPLIFDGTEIKPKVREILLKIANYFWDSMELDINYQDILLLGSSANYNWTENSDIDLHILVDFNKFSDPELIKKYFDSVRSKFNESHDLKIGDNEVELYIQDSNEPNASVGIFSILDNKWIQDPVYEKIEIPDTNIDQEADKFKQQIDQLISLPPTEDTLDQISKFTEELKQYRQSGLDKDGEYSIENLTFKELRNSGYIEKLLNYKNNVIDKFLVTEVFDKPVDAYPFDESGEGTYLFASDSGNQYVVYVDAVSENRIAIDFGIADETGDIDYPETNVGELYKVMSTIIAIAKDYINKHPEIEIISWSSVAKRGQKKIGDTQRDKLYKLILKKQGGLSDKDIRFINGEWWAYLKGYETVFENNFPNPFEDEVKPLNFLLNIKEKKDPFGLNAYARELPKGLEEADPKTGTGKKPKGSGRRLYTDENPKDTVAIKFKTKEDIVATLNKSSFKSKSHARQSQIINLIHQRVRAAYQNAKDPEVKSRLKRALEYITKRKEASKKKTERLRKLKENLDPKTFKDTGKAGKYGSGYNIAKENQTPEQILDFKSLLLSLTNHLKNHLDITPLPKVKFIDDDTENAKDILGTTAYYDPNNKSIILYTYSRHPKDVLHSYAHEMVHHMQNLENRLININTTDINEDDYLKELEREAYEKGNMLFREWENALENN